MSTIVYQEFHQPSNTTQESSRYVEQRSTTTTTALSIKLTSPKLHVWSAIESLSTTTSSKKQETLEEQTVYIHPLTKRSSSSLPVLSEKSLEMCTESLGSETGSYFTESSASTFLLCSPNYTINNNNDEGRIINKARQEMEKKKIDDDDHDDSNNQQGTFPPPLTTISGSNPIHFRAFREAGRLVVKAVPSAYCYMKAERSDGRLRLSMVRDYVNNDGNTFYDDDNDDIIDEDNISTVGYDCTENDEFKGEVVRDDQQEEGGGGGGDEKEECYFDTEVKLGKGEDMDGIKMEFGVKVGIKGDFQRPTSRCKEGGPGNKRLINWEPFWVAT